MKELNPSNHEHEWLAMCDSSLPFDEKLETVSRWFFQHPSLDPRFVDKRGQRVYNQMTGQLEPRIAGYIGDAVLPTGALIISKAPFQVRILAKGVVGMEMIREINIYDLLPTESWDFVGVRTRKLIPFRGSPYFEPPIPIQIQPELVLEQLMSAYSNFSVWFGTEAH